MPAVSKYRLTAYVFLLINTFLWGIASPIIKYSLEFTSPATFLLYRYLLATLLFFPIFLLYKSRSSYRPNLKQLIVLALLGTPLTLLPLFTGLSATSAIEASILVAGSPIITIIGGVIYLHEKLTRKEVIGTAIALVGTLLLVAEPLFSGQPLNQTLSLKGNLLILVSNIIWSAFLILSKKNHLDPIYLTFTSFCLSIPFFLALSLTQPGGLVLSESAIPGVIYMAIFGSIIAFWAYQEGQKRIEASEAAIFSYLQPAFSIPLSILWLKEPFSLTSMTATAIIITGVFISEKRRG